VRSLGVLLLSLAVLLSLTAPVLAGQCPSLVRKIDAKLGEMQLPPEKAAEIKALRDEGARLHRSGQHGDSVATLKKALAMLGM